jgi:HEAT repeat protein
MTIEELRKEYVAARESRSVAEHRAFIGHLLASNDPKVMGYHFELLKDRTNRDLYYRLRAAFKKRGAAAVEYLVERIKTEKDPHLLGDAMHLLGGMNRPEAASLARQLIYSGDAENRDKASYVLGWVGTESDADSLRDRLLNDPDPKVRVDAATAHDQMRLRLPQITDRLLANLKQALETEKDEEVLAWVVITIQYFLGKTLGLKENIEEGGYSGNVWQAREKARAALSKSRA